ncbi:MAG: hypothetical protein E7166_06100 [Firmicutes bacterium]|nr:hypothetical protein [Bacillota bacterium]
MKKYQIYMDQNIFNPKYLFHGSPYIIKTLEPRQSIDVSNKKNEDNAIFLTSWFINAAAYAFRNKLKEINEHWSFSINNDGNLPAMSFEVDILPEDLYGYIYVFDNNDEIIKDNFEYTTQYRCYHNLNPIDVIKVYYRDFADYFNREIT